MNGIARYLAAGIDIVSQSKITAINHLNGAWSLTTDEDTYTGFDWLVLAIPAPQIALLMGVRPILHQSGNHQLLCRKYRVARNAVSIMVFRCR